MKGSARQISAEILQKMERDGAYSNLSLTQALKKHPPADPRDAALITMLVYGVTERKLTLDYNLQLYLKQPLKKLPPPVLQALRLGAYQILFADKIPAAAAVNESVKLVRSGGFTYAAGLTNAVLRKLAANGARYPETGDALHRLSIRYSVPEPLVRLLKKALSAAETEAALSAFLEKRPLYVRLNPLKTTEEALRAALETQGASLTDASLPGAYILENSGDLTRLAPFTDGWFFVQDLSSQTCASLLDAQPGETVLDCCAAPGGKSFAAAMAMKNQGRLISCDLYEQKTALIRAGAERLGISCLETVCCDARELPENLSADGAPLCADRVLCDVPCSGLGVMGRKPEIRYKDPAELSALPALQYEILCAAAKLVKPGGVPQYSTCTLLPAENEDVCSRFLAENPAFAPASDPAYIKACSGGPFARFLPGRDRGDGFFVAKMKRTG